MIELIKKDTLIKGLILGLISPVIGFYLYKLSFFSYFDTMQFYNHLLQSELLAPMISICLIFNAAAFFYFIQKDKLLTSRGIILATFIYGAAIVYLKFK